MNSLHTIMSNQTFAMGDLRTQLDEIQEVLDRVNPKQENMTTEERQIVQNAQMMKDLAEDVIATKLASTSQQHRKDSIQDHRPNAPASLSLSLPSLTCHPFDPTEAPPPTAATPPPRNAFPKGHLRHQSSTASMTTDRSYTPEGDDRPSRPSSASSARRQQKKKSRQSLRQLEPLSGSGQGSNKYDEESNAAFDRICSLLTHMITDASTAVSTAPDGSQQPSNIPLPQFSPLVTSDSEGSAHSGASDNDDEDDDEADQDSTAAKAPEDNTPPQDDFMKRLQGPEGVPPMEELDLEIEEPKPSVRYRKSLRSRYDQPTKRLSSLFMELSNTQKTGDNIQDDLPSPKFSPDTKSLDSDLAKDKEKPVRKPRHSVSSMSMSSTRSSRPSSMYVSSSTRQTDTTDAQSPLDGRPLSPKTAHVPRHRASTSSMRSSSSPSRSDSLPSDLEVQQVFQQGVNSELDRTVETIDGLTRDLVAVATHQNWMQMKLQKTLHFQKQQVEKIDLAHSNLTTPRLQSTPHSTSSRELGQHHHHHQTTTVSNDPMEPHHPLADLSRSLKQVAVSVGKVLANSTPASAHSRNRLVESQLGPSESEDSTTTVHGGGRSTPTPASRKEFTRYFQELEKVAAIGGKIGFDKTEVDGFDTRELLGESLDHRQERHYASRDSHPGSDGHDSHHYESDHQETFNSGKGQHSAYQSRRGSGASAGGPPELEDFAAQCRLLTRALVLPFVQLTHHAMTSQDSALSLAPRISRFTDQAYEGATLGVVEDLDVSSGTDHTHRHSKQSSSTSSAGTRRSSLTGSSLHTSTPRDQKKSLSPLSSPFLPAAWTSSLSLNGRDLDSILKDHGELSPDAVVKARSVISTGLYLIHLLYWPVLFVIGTIVLDPWLAETAGQQVVRIVEQVRHAVAKDGLIGPGVRHAIDDGHLRQRRSFEQQQQHHRVANEATSDSDVMDDQLSLDQDLRQSTFATRQQHNNSNHWNAVHDDEGAVTAPNSSRLQDLEDRAIEVAVGFESLKQRLGSSPSSANSSARSSFRPVSGLWNGPTGFQSTASALTEATRTFSPDPALLARSNSQTRERPLSQTSAASSTTTESSVLRTISWAGPRRRRATRDGNNTPQARVRRYSNNSRGVNIPVKTTSGEFTMPTVIFRQGLNMRRDRPQTHWGTFGSSSSVFTTTTTDSGFGLGHNRGTFREASSSISSTASSSTTLSELNLSPYNLTAGSAGADLGKVNLVFGGGATGLATKAFNWVQTGAATAVDGAKLSQGRRKSM
ncbi:hypothetical protein BGW39_011587 [Mortierella sp. 14UC]|nr:hypothetical protein BGW39_011587 [Mortierella sp. 14UC]